jgi:tetratricopeptide (TPR) repeat protein
MAVKPPSKANQSGSSVKISLCMIVKDEETMLPRCLKSAQDFVDEIIVVDTGSTDRTVEIAQQFGAAVYHHPWKDDFADARNASLQYAQSDWILVLDADETLMPECIPALQPALTSPNCLAVTLLREEIGAQQNPYSLVCRLFRRHPQIQFQRPFHETIDDDITALMQQEPRWAVHSLSTPAIAHDGYRPEAIAQRQKSDRAERIMSRYLKTHPQDAYLCSKLGALYVTQGQHALGLSLLEQGLATQPEASATCYELYYHLGLAYTATQQIALAQQHYELALETELPDVLKLAACINLAALYSDSQNWNQAEALLTYIVLIQPDLADSRCVAIAHYNLGLVYKAQGNFSAAIAAYGQAIALQPNNAEAYQNLGVVYFKQGQVLESLAAFQEAIALHTLQGNTAEALRLQQTLADMGWQV